MSAVVVVGESSYLAFVRAWTARPAEWMSFATSYEYGVLFGDSVCMNAMEPVELLPCPHHLVAGCGQLTRTSGPICLILCFPPC